MRTHRTNTGKYVHVLKLWDAVKKDYSRLFYANVFLFVNMFVNLLMLYVDKNCRYSFIFIDFIA